MPHSSPSAPDPIQSLYVAHQPWLLGWLRRRMGNACDAADLLKRGAITADRVMR